MQVRTPAGAMDVFIAHPAGGKPSPAVILYMDMWGMREVLCKLVRRVAQAGYFCILPDLYYRQGRIRYADKDEPRPGKSFAELPPEKQVLLKASMDGLSDTMVLEDTSAILDFLDSNAAVIKCPVGAVGYCMGGRHAICAAGKWPDRIRAAACIHGAFLFGDGDDSPHRLAARANGELYFGHAQHDRYAPPDVPARLDHTLSAAGVSYRQVVHPGAQHGYAIPDRDVYDHRASEQDWASIFAMLERTLRQAA